MSASPILYRLVVEMARPDFKEDIAQAALKMLHQRGFNATGVQDITDAAGVPKGSFYNHFGSKEDLGVEALERYWQKSLVVLEVLKNERLPPLTRLKVYFRELGRISDASEYRMGCLIGNMSAEMSDQSVLMRERLASIFAAWTQLISVCVRAAQDGGALRNDIESDTIANFIVNTWEGTVLRGKVDRNSRAQQTFEEVVFEMLLMSR